MEQELKVELTNKERDICLYIVDLILTHQEYKS